MFMIIISVIVALVFVYIQISIYLYDVKLNMFYIVQSSISKEDYQNIVFRDYTLNEDVLKENINRLFQKNYLEPKRSNKGIVNVECYEVKVINTKSEVIKHTKNKYDVPVICIRLKVIFNPLISVLGNEIEIKIHDDIKLSLLEFS